MSPEHIAGMSTSAEMRPQAFIDLPNVPIGRIMARTAYAANMTDVLHGLSLSCNLGKAAA